MRKLAVHCWPFTPTIFLRSTSPPELNGPRSRFLCELVVGDDVGPLSRLGHARDANGRQLRHAQDLCRLDSPLSGDNVAIGVDKDRVGKVLELHALHDLLDPLLAVRTGGRECGFKLVMGPFTIAGSLRAKPRPGAANVRISLLRTCF